MNRRYFTAGLTLAVLFLITLSVRAIFSGPDDEVFAIVRQSSGSIVVAGRFLEHRIMRLGADGARDPSFESSWTTGGFNGPVLSLAREADDAIIAGGEFGRFDTSVTGFIARLRADGSLDVDFARNIGTGFDDIVTSVQILPDGAILAGGSFLSFNGTQTGRIARLRPDGTLDPSFRAAHALDQPVQTLLPRANGTVIIIGGDFRTLHGIESPYVAAASATTGEAAAPTTSAGR